MDFVFNLNSMLRVKKKSKIKSAFAVKMTFLF